MHRELWKQVPLTFNLYHLTFFKQHSCSWVDGQMRWNSSWNSGFFLRGRGLLSTKVPQSWITFSLFKTFPFPKNHTELHIPWPCQTSVFVSGFKVVKGQRCLLAELQMHYDCKRYVSPCKASLIGRWLQPGLSRNRAQSLTSEVPYFSHLTTSTYT